MFQNQWSITRTRTPFSSYCCLLRVSVKKNIEKTLFVSAGAWKMWKTVSSGSTLPQFLPNPNSKFPVKFIFTQSILVLLSNDKNTKAISLKVYKKMDFKNSQQETGKRYSETLMGLGCFCYDLHNNFCTAIFGRNHILISHNHLIGLDFWYENLK